MDEWKLEIKKVGNGYILKGEFNDSNEDESENVIGIPNTEFGELEGMEILLYEVMEHFAVHHDKHSKKNLIIKIEKNKERD